VPVVVGGGEGGGEAVPEALNDAGGVEALFL